MDGWEWNKLGAALFAVLAFLLAAHLTAEAIFAPPPPAVQAAPPQE